MSLTDQFKQQSEALAGFKKQSNSDGTINGVSVPVSIDRNGAKLRLYINLNPAVIQSPEALSNVLDELEQIFDLDTWEPPRGSGSGFKSRGYGNRNGYNNYNNGGWRR